MKDDESFYIYSKIDNDEQFHIYDDMYYVYPKMEYIVMKNAYLS